MDHRDRAAPIALPRHAPIAQAEGGLLLAHVPLAEPLRDFLFRILDGLAVQEGGIREAAWPGIGLVADLELGRVRVLGNDHGLDLELVFAGEVQVALVVRGAAEDRAGAVIHEDEVGDVNRQFHGRAEGMGRDDAGVVALLLGAVDLLLRRADLAALLDERRQLRIVLGERLGQRVLGRDADEARAEDRVGPRGEHLDLGEALRQFTGATALRAA